MEITEDLNSKKAQMRKGLLEYCILLAISHEERYASDILEELKGHDLIVVEGTLYPLLSRLRSDKLLDYTWKESKAGPPRKYYRLTDKGGRVLEELGETWHALLKSITSLNHKHEKNS